MRITTPFPLSGLEITIDWFFERSLRAAIKVLWYFEKKQKLRRSRSSVQLALAPGSCMVYLRYMNKISLENSIWADFLRWLFDCTQLLKFSKVLQYYLLHPSKQRPEVLTSTVILISCCLSFRYIHVLYSNFSFKYFSFEINWFIYIFSGLI